MKQYILSIDPSINFLGWALWHNKKLKKYGLIEPSKKSLPYLDKCREAVTSLRTVIDDNVSVDNRHYPKHLQIVTEIPDHFGTSGFMSRESGAITKLSFLAGMIFNLSDDVVTYVPRAWKGNLNKHQTAIRLAMRDKAIGKLIVGTIKYCKDCEVEHPELILRHDIIDAIGIGYKYIYRRI